MYAESEICEGDEKLREKGFIFNIALVGSFCKPNLGWLYKA
jgi:hypothetical protein